MAIMGKYLYCIIEENEKVDFGTSSIGGFNGPVYTINIDELAAVVSEAPVIDYMPSRKNTLAHHLVLNQVMENYTVIPIAFGTVANSRKEVEDLIKSNYQPFLDCIHRLKDKVELGLKVLWNKDYFDKDIQDERIRTLKLKIDGKEENSVLGDKILLGKLVEASIQAKREFYKDALYTPLENIATDSKFKESLPIKTVLNSYFLVDKSKLVLFDKKVEELAALYKDILVFSYTGPWAPYNFTDMNINVNNLRRYK